MKLSFQNTVFNIKLVECFLYFSKKYRIFVVGWVLFADASSKIYNAVVCCVLFADSSSRSGFESESEEESSHDPSGQSSPTSSYKSTHSIASSNASREGIPFKKLTNLQCKIIFNKFNYELEKYILNTIKKTHFQNIEYKYKIAHFQTFVM